MKKLSLCIVALFLLGCTTTTTIKLPEGDSIEVKSGRSSLVKVSRADTMIEVDNRGKPTFIEQLLSILVMNGQWMSQAFKEDKGR